MKRRRWIRGGVILALAVVLLFLTDIVELAAFLPKIRLRRTETISSSVVTLQAVRNVYTFNTVEYVHRAVFPYDYLPEGFTRDSILAPTRNASGPLDESLSPGELLSLEAYNLATEIGLNPDARRHFVVVTVVLAAGFDLEGAGWALETGDPAAWLAEATGTMPERG